MLLTRDVSTRITEVVKALLANKVPSDDGILGSFISSSSTMGQEALKNFLSNHSMPHQYNWTSIVLIVKQEKTTSLEQFYLILEQTKFVKGRSITNSCMLD